MRALIINLARSTDRMAFMANQMDGLGLSWERIEAVTPETLLPPASDRVWHRWQRPLRVTEMALCASHMAAWRRVLTLGEPCLVLEDDAVLAAATPAFLERAASLSGVDHISLETRSRRKLVSRRLHPRAPIRRLWQDRTGSAAYVVFPRGARLLLDHAELAAAPSDALISSTYAMRSYQADPALCVQLDQCAAYGLPQPIPTASTIDAVTKPGFAPETSTMTRVAFRARRVGAQLRMGLRQVLRMPVAERREVRPTKDW